MVIDCMGERYIGCGKSDGVYELAGTPGNALGAYLDGAKIHLHGNAQDATGDTMNCGSIIIDGNTGDAAGYAMRGGEIYVRGCAGYRAGIHMKEYREKKPVIVIGKTAGSFLGEYQAGGIIVVFGIGAGGALPVGSFCGTGMHGGKMYIRCDGYPEGLPDKIHITEADSADMTEIAGYAGKYCSFFGGEPESLLSGKFYKLMPDSKNPYRQLYTYN